MTRLWGVADSATETDSEEFSYPARLDYPELLNRVSPQASLGMDWKNFTSGELSLLI